MRLEKGLRRRLDLLGAVKDEAETGHWSVPTRSIERAVRGREEDAARYLTGVFASEFPIVDAQVIQVAKQNGVRPLHVMSFPERVLYRAVTYVFRPRLTAPDRSSAAFDLFKASPLEVPGTKYIVSSDLSAFYQYVDHELLESELVAQTGEAGAAAAVTEILQAVVGRRFGLPQMNKTSDILSEVVIDILERRLIRAGYEVSRFNDDFRIATTTARMATRALDDIEDAARAIGLTVNEPKTYVQTVEDYRGSIAAGEAIWRQVTSEVHLDLRQVDWSNLNFYEPPMPALIGEEDHEETPTDAETLDNEARGLWSGIAGELLDLWWEHVNNKPRDWSQAHVFKRLLRQSLKILRGTGDPVGLTFCKRILTYDRESTPQVAAYLRRMATEHFHGVLEVFKELSSSDVHISHWQSMWLFEPLLQASDFPAPLAEFARVRTDFGVPDLVRARAALVMATHSLQSPRELAQLFEEVGAAAKPDVAVAIATAADPKDRYLKSVRQHNVLTEIIIDSAQASADV